MAATSPRAPAGLKARGRRFWRDTTGEYDLSAAELNLLEETCRTLDDLDRLHTLITEQGASVKGSTGQTVINPALTEARGQRALLHRLVAALALPDDDGAAVPPVTTMRASQAARARWAGHVKEA